MNPKPCPCCKRPTETTQRGGGWTVDCTFDVVKWNVEGCPKGAMSDGFKACALKGSSQMDMYPTEEEAIKAWNDWLDLTLTKSLFDILDEMEAALVATKIFNAKERKKWITRKLSPTRWTR